MRIAPVSPLSSSYRPTDYLSLERLLDGSISQAFRAKGGQRYFAVTVVVWILGYFNGGQDLSNPGLRLGCFIEPLFSP